MAIVLTVLVVLLLGEAAHLFLLLFLAILISLALGALADTVTRYTRVPRRYALIIAILIALAVIAGFMWLIVPVVIEQTQSLLGTLPDRLIAWQRGIDEAAARVTALKGVYKPGQLLLAAYTQLSSSLGGLFPKIVGVAGVVIEIVVVAILSIYVSNQPGLYRELLISLFPPVHRDLVRNVGEAAARDEELAGEIREPVEPTELDADGARTLRKLGLGGARSRELLRGR